jgi:hypothetical protein
LVPGKSGAKPADWVLMRSAAVLDSHTQRMKALARYCQRCEDAYQPNHRCMCLFREAHTMRAAQVPHSIFRYKQHVSWSVVHMPIRWRRTRWTTNLVYARSTLCWVAARDLTNYTVPRHARCGQLTGLMFTIYLAWWPCRNLSSIDASNSSSLLLIYRPAFR